MLNKSRGRPRGRPPTREHIAEAAQELFLRHGFRRTTVRAVAARAGVDSAAVIYHFGTKQGLFVEVMRVACSRTLNLAAVVDGPAEGLADRLLCSVVDGWEATDPAENRLAARDEDVMRVLRDYLENEVISGLAEYLGGPDATERATAAVALIGGVIFTRYLNPLAPVTAMTPHALRRVLGPPLHSALYPRRTPTHSRIATR
ncbi:TetR family transcriptional regulator [Nocardia sp. NEAU-G5]|uniref:TetR family transcriptional regulator n=1 Tax=Nocardia albiluteola TaxID=2842303 RepID=A0ABS6B5B0_9NOCA|nr:TetR/AcrR family transcriptional regulator [Nocardia albiluteola]MBU3062672.1 TetR family transcriptional regulator [Nocardia albiluteola]MBU3065494.1 TetR family transcriptional regulator [Nocardia albiluteola]